MANVSGRVVFDRDRSATISSGDSGLANIPVVLQNINTNQALTVLTDAAGNYSFFNVPAGDYRIVESYGEPGGVPTPGDFAGAAARSVPQGANPPISAAANPPSGATNLDSLTPDTLLVAVTGAGLSNQNFLNGPVIYTPIQAILDPCAIISGENLITAADFGTFGGFPPGTPANTGAPAEPYPGVTPDFIYVLPNPEIYAPTGGEYTVQNIMSDALSASIGAWWRIADHTEGNETGRMMIVNGANPGTVFFRTRVAVRPNTNYLFTSWILNLFRVTGYPTPELGVRILEESGGVLYSATLGAVIPVSLNAPEWKEIGSVINSRDNTSLIVEFLSEGPEVVGNDYAIDDISFNEIQVPSFIPIKTADRQSVNVGERVRFTLTLANPCESPLTNLFFRDRIPNGLAFVPGSVVINGAPAPSAEPDAGFPLPDAAGGSAVTIIFDAAAEVVPSPNPALNSAAIDYSYTPVEGGIPGQFHVTSNEVPVSVGTLADVSVEKTADPSPAAPGGVLTFSVTVANAGPSPAENTTLSDSAPPELSNAEFSADGGVSWQPWLGAYALGRLEAGSSRVILLRGNVSSGASGSIINTVIAASETPDPDPSNNSDTAVTPVTEQADISVVKLGVPKPVTAGETLTYTLTISNAGPAAARGAALTDALPGELSGAEFSVDNGATFQPWSGTYLLGELPPGSARTLLIRAAVSAAALGFITNTAVVTSDTPDPDLSNNTSTDDTPIETSADLAIAKSGSPSPVPAGDPLTYTIRISNNGPSDALEVSLTDAVPAGLSGAEYSLDNGANWQPWNGAAGLGVLAAGASRIILLRGIAGDTSTGVITNTAVVSAATPDPNPENNEAAAITPINTAADLAVTKSGSPNPAAPGQYLVYSVTVRNQGPNPAVNAVLTDGLPPVLTNAEFSADGGASWSPWPGSYAFGTLANGETRLILLRGVVSQSAAGIIYNTAVIASDTPDPDPSNNQDTSIVPIGESADLSVTKSAYPIPVTAGGQLTYTLTVFNAGPSAAARVELADRIPAAILEPEFAVQGGSVFSPWQSPYLIGDLAAGETFVVTIRGTADPGASGEAISNTAAVSSDTPDPDPTNNTDSAETPVAQSADLLVTKSALTRPAVPGQPFQYSLTVTNAGPSQARSATLIDAVPAALDGVEYSADGGLTYFPWQSPYPLGDLAPGESRVILIRGVLNPGAVGQLVNTAAVSGATPDPNPDNNTSTDATPIQPAADLSIIKLVNPNPVPAGGQLNYTLLIANAGPAAAENAALSDPLPPELSGAEVSRDFGETWSPFTGQYPLGTLEVGAAAQLLIRAAVSPGATGTLTNTASVSSDTFDPDLRNNSSTAGTVIIPSADLSIEKSAFPDPAEPGDSLTYTLVIANAGPADAQNVLVQDNVPSALSDVEFSLDSGGTWRPWTGAYAPGILAAGEAVAILLRGIVNPLAGGSLINIGVVTSDTPDPDLSNNTDINITEISSSLLADLSVTKRANFGAVIPGDPIIYTVTITNLGPNNAERVILYDAVSPELEDVQFSLDGGGTWRDWENPYTLGDLRAGKSAEVLIRGIVGPSACGTISNTAVATSDTPDPAPANNTDTVEVTIARRADLLIRKTAIPNPACRCQYLTFNLSVFNAGPDTAEEVIITDELPGELCKPVFSANQGLSWRTWTGSYTVGSLAAGESFSILVAGIVDACAECFVNTASVSTLTLDPDLSNNTASIAVRVWEKPCRKPKC